MSGGFCAIWRRPSAEHRSGSVVPFSPRFGQPIRREFESENSSHALGRVDALDAHARYRAAAMPGAPPVIGTASGRTDAPFSMSKTSAPAPPRSGKRLGQVQVASALKAGEDDDRAIGGQRIRARRHDRCQRMAIGLARHRE